VQVGYGKLYKDYLNGTTIYQESAPIELAPWGFKIIKE